VTKNAYGEGTNAYKRTDNRFGVSIRLEDGTRKWFYGKTKKAAQEKLRAAKVAIAQGQDLGQPNQLVKTYLTTWLQGRVRLSVRPSTYQSYELNVTGRLIPHLGSVRLDQLRAHHIEKCYAALAEQGLSPRSVEQAHQVLKIAMRHAVRTGLIVRPPTENAAVPRTERKEMMTLDEEQIQTLLDTTADDRLHALWALLVTTGLRVGEALGLEWKSIEKGGKSIYIRQALQRQKGAGLVIVEPKTNRSRRRVNLSAGTWDALAHHQTRQKFERDRAKELWTDRGLVFTTETGGPLDPGSVNDALKKALQKGDLPALRVHDLRHTAASYLLVQGVHPKVVQEMLGHSTITLTLDTYSHVLPSMHDEAAQHMDRLFQGRQTPSMQ
jgi:integrase